MSNKESVKKTADEVCSNDIKVSIITVVYNGEKHIEQTINSVLNQSYNNIEYIIVDGGSTDGTLAIIKQYEDKISYWISESDTGIYNAMNKGIKLCTGDYVAFLNADDWYNPDTVQVMVDEIVKSNVDYVFANVSNYYEDTLSFIFKPNLDKYHRYIPFGHPALYLRRDILLSMGFDERYKVIADYDLIIKLIKYNYSFSYLDKSIVNFRTGGFSYKNNHDWESFLLFYRHFGLVKAIFNYFFRKYVELSVSYLNKIHD